MHTECEQRLRRRARLAGAARIGRNAARLPQGGRTPDSLGDCRARESAVVVDHRGRCGLPSIPTPPSAPRTSWVGPSRPRSSPGVGTLRGRPVDRSSAYALTVLCALYRWLMQQRYVLANPFAGIKVRGAARVTSLAATRAFSDGEWNLIRAVADGLEWSFGWSRGLAATALRARLRLWHRPARQRVCRRHAAIETDEHGATGCT